jgi:uncharacterized protein YbjT (DUF2867 family)
VDDTRDRTRRRGRMTSPVLVTGGTGRLGRQVVTRLVDAKCDVRVLARHQRDTLPQVTFFTGDLRRGEGIDPAVRGVSAIIHCATSTKGDADATRNLVSAATRIGSPRLVHPSIVGIDRIASWGYTKAKLEAERIVENSGLPWTIIRLTQFYDYCFDNSAKLAKFRVVAPVPAGFRVQPVDPGDVAVRLVELALGEPAGRAPDMAGPHVSTWVDLFRSYLAATHRHRRLIPVLIPGTKAVRDGALLPSSGYTLGTRTWDEFLAARLRQLSVDMGSASHVNGG